MIPVGAGGERMGERKKENIKDFELSGPTGSAGPAWRDGVGKTAHRPRADQVAVSRAEVRFRHP